MNTKTRNINDDCIRVISMIMVIMIHANWEDLVMNPWLNAVIMTIISVCNCFFFMLSGKYNLRVKFESGTDVIRFYKKRTIDILFPYVLISVIISIWNYTQTPEVPMTFKDCFYFTMKELFSTNMQTHLWFMFYLLGFILSTPFLSRMLHAMSDSELHALMIVGLIWNAVTIMFQNTHHDFYYGGWLMSGWIIYYIAGYYFDRVTSGADREKIIRRYYIAGVIGFVINIVGMALIPDHYVEASQYTVPFVLFVFAFFLILEQKIRITGAPISEIIGFLVKHAFTVYLIHFCLLIYLVDRYVCFENAIFNYFVKVIVTLLISLAVAVPLDWFLGICRRFMKKMMIRE